MNNFEVVIGIENHIELKTKTKIFSSAPVTFASEANTSVNEVDFGCPGALPSLNKECVKLAILTCNAFNMEIDPLLRFDRKNYYYPDLAKGFQITQQFFPIGKNGVIDISNHSINKKIEIERIHLEEDTAKQTHEGEATYIDYNRSGIGLIEVVSKPLIRNSEEAISYLENLREIVLFLGVSDAKMSEGSMRCDINISLRPKGYDGLGQKVEIKNLNSLSNVKKSIDFEIKRQSKILLSGGSIEQETRRFDEQKQETILMRKKVNAVNYKYFREPNILPIRLDDKWVKKIISSSPELPTEKRNKYSNNYKLNQNEIDYLMSDIYINEFFEKCIKISCDPTKIINYLIGDILSLSNSNKIPLSNSKLTPEKLNEIINLQLNGVISSKHIKTILPLVYSSDEEVLKIIERLNLKLISNEDEIKKLLEPIILKNKSMIDEQYKERPERVEKNIMGLLMKETGGNVNPEKAISILKTLIK